MITLMTNRSWDQYLLILLFLFFDLMIDLLITRMIMRLNVANSAFWVLISLSNVWLTNGLWDQNSKLILFRLSISWWKFWLPDRYDWNFWYHGKRVLISWSLFWSHDSYFDLMKNSNFNLKKFSHMIISPFYYILWRAPPIFLATKYLFQMSLQLSSSSSTPTLTETAHKKILSQMPSTSSLIAEGTSGTQNQGRFIKRTF
jgi:hypothetical protein